MSRALYTVFVLSILATGCGDTTPTEQDGGSSDPSASGATAGKSLPDDLPSDIPIYPSSIVKSTDDSQPGYRDSYRMSIVLETTDSIDKVRAFFKEQVKEQAWNLEKEFPSGIDASKDDRTFHVSFLEMPAKPGHVSMNVIYTKPKP